MLGMRPFPQRWTFFIGPDGKVLHIAKNVKPGKHGEELVAKLTELETPTAEE